MIYSREISYFFLLFGLVALVQVHDVTGDIDIDKIDRQLSNPCVPNGRRRRDVGREILEILNSTSKVVFLEFEGENPGYCRFAEKYTDLADIGVKEELPVRTSSSQLCDDLKFYYAWMLWIREAKQYMDIVDVQSFSVPGFDEMVNILRQAVCECPPGASRPLFPDSTPSTDPVDYLEPACYVLERFSQFSTSAYGCTRKGRKGNSKQKKKLDQPDKSASVVSPPTGTASGRSVKRGDGNIGKGQGRRENKRKTNRKVDQNAPGSTWTDNSKRLPEESTPGKDKGLLRGNEERRKGHNRKRHGGKRNGGKGIKPSRISTLDVKNLIETTESKQINKSDNTAPCVTKPETTKPERRGRKKGKENKRTRQERKRRRRKNKKDKRAQRERRRNRRMKKQRKNKNKNRNRGNKENNESTKMKSRPFSERKGKETKSILDFFFF